MNLRTGLSLRPCGVLLKLHYKPLLSFLDTNSQKCWGWQIVIFRILRGPDQILLSILFLEDYQWLEQSLWRCSICWLCYIFIEGWVLKGPWRSGSYWSSNCTWSQNNIITTYGSLTLELYKEIFTRWAQAAIYGNNNYKKEWDLR